MTLGDIQSEAAVHPLSRLQSLGGGDPEIEVAARIWCGLAHDRGSQQRNRIVHDDLLRLIADRGALGRICP
jgi:hypothetical protein